MSLTLIICISIAAIAVCAGIGFYFWKKWNKPKLKLETVSKNKDKPELEIVTIQLTAVDKLKGSNKLGFETEEELKARLSSLPLEEFKALNIDDKPWTAEDWAKNSEDDEDVVTERSMIEIARFYAYNHDGSISEKRAEILKRVFEVKK